MELILKSDSESSMAKILALAKSLNVTVERAGNSVISVSEKEDIKNRILEFKPAHGSSFGDALEWQKKERNDRDLPFNS